MNELLIKLEEERKIVEELIKIDNEVMNTTYSFNSYYELFESILKISSEYVITVSFLNFSHNFSAKTIPVVPESIPMISPSQTKLQAKSESSYFKSKKSSLLCSKEKNGFILLIAIAPP